MGARTIALGEALERLESTLQVGGGDGAAAAAAAAPADAAGLPDDDIGAVAAAAAALDRRDAPTAADPIGPRLLTIVSDRGPTTQAAYAAPGAPLGQTYRRTPAPRRAASGARRDQ